MDLQKELENIVNIYNNAVKQKAESSETILKSLGGIEVLQKIIKESEIKDESKVKKVSSK
jgi:hypothetical protein